MAVGAAAAQVEIYEDADFRIDLEHFVQGGDLQLITTQTVKTDLDIAVFMQMVMLTESMTEDDFKAMEKADGDTPLE